MASAMCLHCSMKEEDVLELTNAMCHLCTLLVNLSIEVEHGYVPHNIVDCPEHTWMQVSWGDTDGEVADH